MRLIPLAFLLLPLPAFAGELPANDLVRTMMQHERAPAPTESFLSDPISLGPITTEIGTGLLADAAAVFGASLIDEGKGNVVWACAVSGDEALWLISTTTDFEGEPVIDTVIKTAAPKDETRCASAEIEVSDRFPGLGATLPEIEAVLGSTMEMGGEIVGYRTQNTLGDDGGNWIVIDTLSYHMTDGVADAVGYDAVVVR